MRAAVASTLLLSGLLASALMSLPVTGGEVPRLMIPESAGDHCVEPTPIIRREHMKILLEQRDRTVHDGFRDTQHSLVNCIACHTNREADGTPVSVSRPDQFCGSCHQYAGVTMDCFECHASRPDE
tara:strand:- start:180 stop:557 length:378 start_codon:yes stop_codon:yes gene_type:complete